MIRKHIHMTAEIPVAINDRAIDVMAEDWAKIVLPKLTNSIAEMNISAAEVWDFAESFVIDISGKCTGMDLAATIDTIRSFGARHAKTKFELTTVMDNTQTRKDNVLPESVIER